MKASSSQSKRRRERKEMAAQLRVDEEEEQEMDNQQFVQSLFNRRFLSTKTEGEEANFYRQYKRMNQLQEIRAFLDNKNVTPYLDMLSRSVASRQFPMKMSIIKNDALQKQISLGHFRIGDQRAGFLGDALRHLDNIECVRLSHNRLSDVGVEQILSNLNNRTEELDLSNNSIRMERSYIHLSRVISDRQKNLKVLSLESNGMKDKLGIALLDHIDKGSCRLQVLNLSRNQLGTLFCQRLREFLSDNNALNELYLHWNMVTSQGAVHVCDGLLQNKYLKVLDMSYNNIGKLSTKSKQEPSCVDSWSQVFAFAKSDLLHLDLSNNEFTYEECRLLAECLQKNQKIYGFHFEDNYGHVDTAGNLVLPPPESFLSSIDKESNHYTKPDLVVPVYRRIRGVEKTWAPAARTEQRSYCWICDGWVEKTFVYSIQDSGPDLWQEPVFLHTSVDGFRPHPMRKSSSQQTYEYRLMCPPSSKVYYFFTIQGFKHFPAIDQFKVSAQQPKYVLAFTNRTVEAQLEQVNMVRVTQQHNDAIYNGYYECQIHSVPRLQEVAVLKEQEEKKQQKENWNFNNSIFKDYVVDTEELLAKCFEYDMSQTSLKRMIKDEACYEKVKQTLRQYYELIKRCYKYNASQSPKGEVWSISQNVFGEFLTSSGILDGRLMTLSNTDFNFILVYSQQKDKQSYVIPDRCLVRHQFLEIFVRLAQDKYVKNKVCYDLADAVKMICEEMQDYVNDNINDEQRWRNKNLWNERVPRRPPPPPALSRALAVAAPSRC